MLIRCVCVILLLVTGLTSDSRPAYVPNPASYVYKLHALSHPHVPVLHNRSDQTAADSAQGVSAFVYSGLAITHAAGAVAGYNGLTKLWGASDGRFHFKDEINDKLAFNDEASHLFISYKLAQGFSSAYRVLGFSDGRARLLGMLEAAAIMTAVEFPLDAYNPKQGFGVTDLVANYIGIGLAWYKDVRPELSRFDLKTSIKSLSAQPTRVLGDYGSDYDNYIYWLTYRYKFAVIGTGYSTCRNTSGAADPQLFLGIGSTIPDLIRPISGRLADRLKPLEFYFFNINFRAL